MSAVQQNLKQVKEEANAILKTMAAVKGEQYAEAVRILLLAKQAADIAGMLCEEAHKTQPDMTQACAYGLSASLSTIAMTLRTVMSASEEDWQSILKDSVTIMDSIGGLMRQAVDAGREGASFGGTD